MLPLPKLTPMKSLQEVIMQILKWGKQQVDKVGDKWSTEISSLASLMKRSVVSI